MGQFPQPHWAVSPLLLWLFSSQNIHNWMCSVRTSSNTIFKGKHLVVLSWWITNKIWGICIFSGKALSKRFLHSVGQGVNNGLKIVVCLGKNVNVSKHYHYPELCGRNIVMGDVEYYRDHSNTQFWVEGFNCIIIVNLIFKSYTIVTYCKNPSIVRMFLCGVGSSNIANSVWMRQLLHMTVHKLLSRLCLSIKK